MNTILSRAGWMAPVIAVLMAAAAVGSTSAESLAAAETPPKITDTSIGDTVEDQLFIDQAVPAYAIEASVRDGVVTLTGFVSNILAKERAAKVAETVKGVRAVVNAITVRPAASRKPIDIGEDIVSALEADPATDVWEIIPTVGVGGVVTLNGTVQSWTERDLAARVAKGVKGVTEMQNKIVVESAENRTDAEIRADIERSLRWDALVDQAEIGVSVVNGAVGLTGTVGSAAEWRRARIHAWTAGVDSVDASRLVVARWTRDPALRDSKYKIKSKDEVLAAVRRALELDPRVDADNIDVSIVASMLTLRGAVHSVRAKWAATEDARNTVGVHDVLNRLRVRPENNQHTDADLAARVRDAMVRDPYVERFDIRVSVVNGVAHLDGVVNSYFEKAWADNTAAGIGGVVAVENNLDVKRADRPYPYDPYRDDLYVYDFDWYRYVPSPTLTSDAEIERNVKHKLWWSPYVDSEDITVTVNDGVATLDGTVDTWTEYAAARENAFEAGATWVDNDLSVRGMENN